MIDNPAYIGAWSRKMIANPNYFLDEHPSNFNKIGAIGIELWTMVLLSNFKYDLHSLME